MYAPAASFRDFLRTNWVIIALRVMLEPALSALMNLSATRREFIWWHMLLANLMIFVLGFAASHLAGKHKHWAGAPIIRSII
jgi:hypothetical protein